MRIFLPILAIIAVTISAVFGLKHFKKKPPPKTPIVRIEQVETVTLQPQTHTVEIHSQGTIAAKTKGVLSMEVSGKIISMAPAFIDGGMFDEGDQLLEINPTAYQAAVAQAHAQIAQAELKLQEEQARSEQALKEWKAAQSLTSEKPSDLVLRKPQLAFAKANLEAAKANLKLAERNLSQTKLIAPYAGVIEERLVEVGQVVSPGTPVARAYNNDSLEVKLPISSREVDFLQMKNPAGVTLHVQTATGNKVWNATLVRNSGTVDPRTRFHHVIAEVSIQPEDRGHLLPGQFVTAKIQGQTLENIYRIPRRALLKDDTVYIVTKDDRLLKRNVNILYREQDYLLVDKGLEPGDTLSLTRLKVMNDKMKVRRSDTSAPKQITPKSQTQGTK